MDHKYYIKRTFILAKKAQGLTSPNPLVGAVIVKNGTIIAEGYHEQCGKEHAELKAIQAAPKSLLEGSTLYCNLEPCCHTNKKTPPCAQRIIKEKIAHVVIANTDPNPNVCGTGIKLLQDAGIKVTTEVLSQEGLRLNEIFFTYMTKNRPFIHLKWAQTLDGKIATLSHDSKWITSAAARNKAHQLRYESDAILIGKRTLVYDNPQLTIRHESNLAKKCPFRIVLTDLNLPETGYKLLNDQFVEKTIIATTEHDYKKNNLIAQWLKDKGITILTFASDKQDTIEMSILFDVLKKNMITSVLVEGGQHVLTSCFKNELYDRISVFIEPKIMGHGLEAIGNLGINFVSNMNSFECIEYDHFDSTLYLTAKKKE